MKKGEAGGRRGKRNCPENTNIDILLIYIIYIFLRMYAQMPMQAFNAHPGTRAPTNIYSWGFIFHRFLGLV